MVERLTKAKNVILLILVIIASIYVIIYLGLPYIANKYNFSEKITEIIKKETGLAIIIDKYQLEVSPTLNLTLKTDIVDCYYPNKKPFLIVKQATVNISSLYLLRKELKINKIRAKELQFSTKLLKSGKTTFQEYLEENIKDTKNFTFSQNVPEIEIDKYLFKLKDEESGQKFKIRGNYLKVKPSLEHNYFNFETKGEFYCFENKYIAFDIKANIPKVLVNNFNQKLFDISVDELHKYKFNADLKTNIKLYEKNGMIDTFSGNILIDNFTLNLGTIHLPNSYIHINSDKKTAIITSKLYTAQNEYTDINAKLKLQKPYNIALKCNCESAEIENLQKIAISLANVLKIKNTIIDYETNGKIGANFELLTDFKSIKSNGNIEIKEAEIISKKLPFNIKKINSTIDFSNNSVKFKNTSLFINNQPLKIKGNIDSNANGNIAITAENLDLKNTLNAFPFIKFPQNINLKRGKLTFDAKIVGKLLDAKTLLNLKITNLNLYDKKTKINLDTSNISIDLNKEKNKFSGTARLLNTTFSQIIEKNEIKSLIDKLVINFDNNTITIKPSTVATYGSKLNLQGVIKNYQSNTDLNIVVKGDINTNTIKTMLPKDYQLYSKGYIPIKINLIGKPNNIKIEASAISNNQNYITPIHVDNLINKNIHTILKGIISNEYIQIDELSLFEINENNNLNKVINSAKQKKYLLAKGKITKNSETYENFAFEIPYSLKIHIPQTKAGMSEVYGKIILNGKIKKPDISGNLILKNTRIPEYNTTIQTINSIFDKNKIFTQIDNIKALDASLSMNLNTNTDFIESQTIENININCQTINIETLNKLIQILPSSAYTPGIETPININTGKLYIENLVLPPTIIKNVNSELTLKDNILYLKNMTSSAYNGKIAGQIKHSLPYLATTADIQGRNISAEMATFDLLPKEQRISGKLDFDAHLDFIGMTQEQLQKTAKGQINLLIQNGHLGQLGRFEHFLYAQNLLSQKFINASLNSAKQAIMPKDTGYISYLKGVIKLTNGIGYLSPVITAGPQMSMYITGNIDLLNNYTNLEILGKISSEISSSMGLLGSMTIKDFIKEHTKYGDNLDKTFKNYNSELPEMDISKIPQLNPDYKYQTKNFRVHIMGDPNSVKAVKSFTWINPIGTTKKILSESNNSNHQEALTNSIDKPNNNSSNLSTNRTETKQNSTQVSQPNFLDSIPDYFHD